VSYDLVLAFPVKPDPTSIRAAATAAGLRTEGSTVLSFFDSTNGLVFTADGPYALQANDVDEELLVVMPRPRWGMSISRPAATLRPRSLGFRYQLSRSTRPPRREFD
jgi:hypothetical protein